MIPGELRIGNWYNSVKFGNSVQCELVDLYDLCANSEGAYSHPPIDKMFTPIPLTEEWLKKFGFKPYKPGGNGFRLGKMVIYVLPLCNEVEYDSIDFEARTNIMTNIKYVHQLQNLYFALTGEELTIKS